MPVDYGWVIIGESPESSPVKLPRTAHYGGCKRTSRVPPRWIIIVAYMEHTYTRRMIYELMLMDSLHPSPQYCATLEAQVKRQRQSKSSGRTPPRIERDRFSSTANVINKAHTSQVASSPESAKGFFDSRHEWSTYEYDVRLQLRCRSSEARAIKNRSAPQDEDQSSKSPR